MVKTSARAPALDLLRCIALFSVVLVHFFLNSGFYDLIVSGPLMYLMTLIRSAAMVCVPLFLMLSGYLMGEKQLTAAYFGKLKKTLILYVLASIFCALTYVLYEVLIDKGSVSIVNLIAGIFDYSTAPYAWYVEMYIGLFCFIPFLNILYHGLPGKREKQWLLGILLFSTAVPQITNIFRFSEPGWWLLPSADTMYHKLLPSWWTTLYPITYYYLGCYLREYPLQLKRRRLLLAYLFSVFVIGSFNYYRSAGAPFLWGPWQDWGSLFNTLQTVLLFEFIAHLDLSAIGSFSKRLLAWGSDWSFCAYLVSWVFDEAFYKVLAKLCPNVTQRFLWLPLIVPAVFVCSLLTSAVINNIYIYIFGTALSKKCPPSKTH